MLINQRPLRVGVLCSRRAPGLLHLLDLHDPRESEVVCVISTGEDLCDAARLRERGIPVVTHDIRAFYARRATKVTRDLQAREVFDRETVDLLRDHRPDLVLLDGYLFLLTQPMLDAYRHRLLNLHFSDLTVRRVDRRPAYIGIRAVRDAIVDGQPETRATVHLVNSEPDGGAPLLRSWGFPVSPLAGRARAWQAQDMLKAYAYAHQEWMMREASGPLLAAGLRLVARGQLALDTIGAREPHGVEPWSIDESGQLIPPGTQTRPQRLTARRRNDPRQPVACERQWLRQPQGTRALASPREDREP
ncbi:MAG: formyltransferase family protein [Vicinamibacterales bacterium]